MKVQAPLLTLGLTLIVAVVPHAARVQDPTGSFVLGVLRRDGIVSPFAAFDGRRWSKRWPERLPPERPISLETVPTSWWGVEPVPDRLRQWKDGIRVGEVTLASPAVATPMCEPRLALRSDYKSSEPPPPGFVLPYPKDGLLVSGAVTVEKIAALEVASEEAKGVLALAVEDFNRQESRAASVFTAWRHPVKADDRKKVPVTLEALYRAPTDDPEWTAYFVEAIREYPPGPKETDGCGLATYVSGWVITHQRERAFVRIGARVTYCDRKGVGYMLPFGLVRADGKNYWVFQYAGFEQESYEVIRPTRRTIETAVVYNAGSCGR
jgi:hypothetical protein